MDIWYSVLLWSKLHPVSSFLNQPIHDLYWVVASSLQNKPVNHNNIKYQNKGNIVCTDVRDLNEWFMGSRFKNSDLGSCGPVLKLHEIRIYENYVLPILPKLPISRSSSSY